MGAEATYRGLGAIKSPQVQLIAIDNYSIWVYLSCEPIARHSQCQSVSLRIERHSHTSHPSL